MNIRKLCPRCRRSLTLASFHLNRAAPDRHCQICKVCACKKTRQNRDANLARFRKYDRERSGSLDRRVAETARRARQRASDSQRLRAREIAAWAIKQGDLVRGKCEKCRSQFAEAHHDNYAKPLSVRWLCRRHHLEHHARILRAQAEKRARVAMRGAS